MAKTNRSTPATKAKAAKALNISPAPSSAAKDMYMNQASNTGFGTSSQANAGMYVPYRISLDYLQLLYAYRGSWIVRAIVDTLPEDMLKEWPSVVSKVTPEEIAKFNKVVAETESLAKMIEGLKWGRLFGGAIAIIILAGEHQKNLEKPLVLEDVDLDSYRGLIIVDRWSGCSPSSQLVDDIEDPANYGLPMWYEVTTEVGQNFRVHYSRVIRFVGRDLPLFEKQIQTYWGMSEVEAVWQELQRRDLISAGISDLVARAHVFIMKEPVLAQMLSGVGLTEQQLSDYLMRLRAVSQAISTNGIMPLSEDAEFYSQSYTFAGLKDINDSSMENLSGASGIPMSKLGRPETGLGNTGEGALQNYNDSADQKRKKELRPAFNKLNRIIAMSTWGMVPDDFDYRFAPIRSMTAKERAELGKNQVGPLFDAFDKGAIGRQTLLRELKQLSIENGLFSNITDEMIEEADDEVLNPDIALTGELPGDEADAAPGGKAKPGSDGAKDAAAAWSAKGLVDWISNRINVWRAEA